MPRKTPPPAAEENRQRHRYTDFGRTRGKKRAATEPGDEHAPR